MLIDCDACQMRNLACDDCVVSVVLGHPDDHVRLGPEERRALHVLAAEGLIPPLRHTLRGERAS